MLLQQRVSSVALPSCRYLVARHGCQTTTSRSHSSSSNNSSVFGSSSFWSDLRQKAATAITSSLSEQEREELISKYSPSPPTQSANGKDKPENDKEDSTLITPEIMSKTVAEAAAEARAKEAQLQIEKWEKEKETLMDEMEKAVEDRIATERRRLQFAQWQQDLKKEQEKDEASSADAAVATSTSQQHPLLGPCLVDLNTKRLHLVKADVLYNLPVWKKQRIYRHDRVKVMAKDKAKSLHLGFPGVINLFEDKNGDLAILDGQHRVGMMKLLGDKGASIDLEQILVEVHSVSESTSDDTAVDEDTYARDLFVEINKAEPVKLVDMPGVAKESDRRVLTEAAESLNQQYPDMFSASQNCRVPHLNVDNLRDALFAANVIKKHSLSSPKKLLAWLLNKNEALAAKYQSDEDFNGIPARALTKAQKFEFYLGLEPNWMYE